jgi:outer membrane receptor protein involved in Fe transport
LKGETPGHALSLDASVYYINWKNMQTGLLNTEFSQNYTANAGAATSEGVQLSSTWIPFGGLSIAAWAAWNEAVLTSAPLNSTTYPFVGKSLPGSSKWSGRLSLEDDFALTRTLRGFVGGSASFVGERIVSYTPLLTAAGYVVYNLNAGVTSEAWKVNVYANNLGDRRAVLGGGPYASNFPPYSTYYLQPRTIGLTVSKAF